MYFIGVNCILWGQIVFYWGKLYFGGVDCIVYCGIHMEMMSLVILIHLVRFLTMKMFFSGHPKINKTKVLKTGGSLVQVENIKRLSVLKTY